MQSGQYTEQLTFNFDETPLNFGVKYPEQHVTQSGAGRPITTIPERIRNMSVCLTICANGAPLRSKIIWKGSSNIFGRSARLDVGHIYQIKFMIPQR